MGKTFVTNKQQQAVAQQQPVAAQQVAQQQVTVQQVLANMQLAVPQQTLRVTRLQRVAVAAQQRYLAAKTPVLRVAYQQKVANAQGAVNTAQQQAYMAVMQQVAAHMGVPVPNTLSVRSVPGVQKNAPSNAPGACARVRAWVHANPSASVAAAKQHFSGSNYVNPATVQTQYQLAKKGKA